MSRINIAIIGYGGVGKAFVSQLGRLKLPSHVDKPVIVFLSRSRRQIYSYSDYAEVDPGRLDSNSQDVMPIEKIRDWLAGAPGKTILVDNTSSMDVANEYPAFLKKGISVVTPNKKGFSAGMKLWNDIFSSVSKDAVIYHESSVGAGLPTLSTLRDLINTGDEVTKIEGVFSGTMSFLFNTFAPASGNSGGKWSTIVGEAKDAGFTEPDPRDDLNGMDVARKCTILARLAGLKIDGPESFPVQSLIPKELESAKHANEFMQRLPDFDQQMEKYKTDAESEGKLVRFLASVDVKAGRCKVGLEMVSKDSPIAALNGSDNIFVFHTKRYSSSPLVIQGSGAGGDVTAMGVSSDLLKVIERLS